MTIRLEIEPAYRDALATAGYRTFDDFMNAPAGPAVSRHRHRETVPLELAVNGQRVRFYLKRVFCVPPSHVIRPMLRFRRPVSQPMHEWAVCDEWRAAGLPAMQRVAAGERRQFGVPVQAFLLVESSPVRTTLEEWIVPGFPRPMELNAAHRQDLFRSLGELVRRIVTAGYDWPDFDPKHIFAEPAHGSQTDESACDWRFCLIDLERVRRLRPAGDVAAWQRSVTMATLCTLIDGGRPMALNGDDHHTIFKAAGIDPAQAPLTDFLVRRLFGGLPRLPDGYVHPRRVHHARNCNMTVDERFIDRMSAAALDSLDAVFRLDAGQALSKPGLATHRDRVRLSMPAADGALRTVYLKRYRHPPFGEQLRRIIETRGFRRSSARREARFARILLGLGIPTMTTIAEGQEMRGGFERRSFLITDTVPGLSLEKLADSLRPGGGGRISPKDRFEIIRQLALVVSRLHLNRLYHRDLYLCHVFVDRTGQGGIVLYLIDLARMIERPLMDDRWVVKDLAAMDYSSPPEVVTRADRVRFLYHYLTASAVRNRESRRAFERHAALRTAVERRTRRTAHHDVRRQARHARA
ncbi:MAG: hypothetical protein KF841_14440 [Phycisphaerae bacterium]|nr:hypothetical protein [Phycisphaerae bacterium]